MVELGCWWAYYTNWYLGAVPGSTALCIEPDPDHLALGRRNLAINGRASTFIQAFVGGQAPSRFGSLPCLDMDAVIERADARPIEVLHMDVQGAELPFIRSMGRAVADRLVRFAVVSTHHESISGSVTTHDDCVRAIQSLGAKVFVEHDVYESYSGDGLIVASFAAEDRSIVMPDISRNVRERSLFSHSISRNPVAFGGPVPLQRHNWLQRQAVKLRRSFEKRLQGGATRRVF
jgi:hypothetical protein